MNSWIITQKLNIIKINKYIKLFFLIKLIFINLLYYYLFSKLK